MQAVDPFSPEVAEQHISDSRWDLLSPVSGRSEALLDRLYQEGALERLIDLLEVMKPINLGVSV